MNAFETAAEMGFTTFTKGAWFRITGSRGNAKGFTGVEGQLQWLAVEFGVGGYKRALVGNKISRIGLKIAGRNSYLFLNPSHVTAIEAPTTSEGVIAVEIMCHAIASLGR